MTATEDLFTPIDKGLRAMMYDLSSRLQTNDFADLVATRVLVDDLEYDFATARSAGCMVCTFHHHAEDEESAVFPDVDSVNRELIASLVLDHHALTGREIAISKSARSLLALSEPAERIRAGVQLNQSANELLAAYIAHMNREESELVPLMQDRFSDEQLAAMRGVIIGRMAPERLVAILRWMLPALNVSELANLVASVRATAPPPLLEVLTKLCAEHVDSARWSAVRTRVGW